MVEFLAFWLSFWHCECYSDLKVPHVKKATFAMRALSVQGPKIWNELPNDIRMEATLDGFKSKLKTFLFKEYFKC